VLAAEEDIVAVAVVGVDLVVAEEHVGHARVAHHREICQVRELGDRAGEVNAAREEWLVQEREAAGSVGCVLVRVSETYGLVDDVEKHLELTNVVVVDPQRLDRVRARVIFKDLNIVVVEDKFRQNRELRQPLAGPAQKDG
jgi:hypothetical protein